MKNKTIVILSVVLLIIIASCLVYYFSPSGANDTGRDFQVEILPVTMNTTKGNTSVLRYDYAKVLDYSLLFYESMRSGKLPADNRVPWRGDSCLECRGPGGQDLSGGYFSDGYFSDKKICDNSITVTLLAWSVMSYKRSFETAGLLDRAKESVIWGANYLLNVRDNRTLYHIEAEDKGNWSRPEDRQFVLQSYTQIVPGTREPYFALLAAAALAASSIVTSESSNMSRLYLEEAENLYNTYMNSPQYISIPILEMWSEIWLFRAIKSRQGNYQTYLLNARTKYEKYNFKIEESEFITQIKVGVMVLSFEFLEKSAPAICSEIVESGSQSKVKPNNFGNNIHLAAMCLRLGAAQVEQGKKKAEQSVHLVNNYLGDSGRSFMTGFGHNPPLNPQHLPSACPTRPAPCDFSILNSPAPNAQKLYGALVRGPDDRGNYMDMRNKSENGVSIVTNAGFQFAVAYLVHQHIYGILPPIAYDCMISLHTVVHDVSIIITSS